MAAVAGKSLHISVASNRFGEYTCIVESLYNTTQVSLLLQEKVYILIDRTCLMSGILYMHSIISIQPVHLYTASFQLLLAENQPTAMECTLWKVYNYYQMHVIRTHANIHMLCEHCSQKESERYTLYEDTKSLFKTVCDCIVDLENVSVDCSMTGHMLLSGTVICSNIDGNVTASTLIDILQVWLLTSADTLQNQPFKLIAQCPVELNTETADAYLNLKLTIPESIKSEAIGGSFIGGVVMGVLTCIVVLFIGL